VQTKQYFAYIATNKTNTVLYTGVTNDLVKRDFQHRNRTGSTFAAKYNVTKLVYYEVYTDILEALSREKQIKAGSRRKKLELIKKFNPTFKDLWNEIVQ
jgi:putative endonuclease